VARLLFGLFAKDGKVYLSMDRTTWPNWRWGRRPINILMLSMVYKGTAIPIYWSMIPGNGNSNTQARIDLVNRFIVSRSETPRGAAIARSQKIV
jgi:hypothetical protein